MRTQTSILAVLVIILALSFAIPAVMAGKAQKTLVVSTMKYQPSPAEPGNFIDVWLVVNNPREEIRDFQITFRPDYPFTLSEDEDPVRSASVLPPLETIVLKYRVFVDLQARNQDYNLTWQYSFGDQSGLIDYDTPITVQATDASLTIDRYSITPSPVRPGANATLAVSLKNNGRITLKDIDVNLDLSSANSFMTYGTGTIQRVSYITPGETKDVSYQLISDPKAETKIHVFPVAVNFRDERNNRYNGTSRIAAIVNAAPKLMVSIHDTKLVSGNSTGDVTFKVVNNGAVDLKYLTLRLEPSNDYDTLSPSLTSYLGNLEADDFETAEFKVQSRNWYPVFKVGIEFSDPYNNRFDQSFDVPLRIIDAQSLEPQGSTRNIVIGVLVVLAALVAWFARKRLKKVDD